MVPAGGLSAVYRKMPRKKTVLAKRSKEERRAERLALGSLRSQVVAPATEARYLTSVSRFLTFLKSHQKPYPTSFLLLDRDVAEFIELLWGEGEPKSWASDCLSGLGHFIPAVKPHLISSWRLHSAWTRSELPARAPPLTSLLTYALAQLAFQKTWTDTAVLLILGFHTFARTGELFAARAGDFVLGQHTGTWSLPLSKSGQRSGAAESIVISDRFVVACVRNFTRAFQPGDLLSQTSPGIQRRRLTT